MEIYENTRRFVLSEENPYFMRGPVLSAVGGPHIGPGKPWPMAAIVRALTAYSLPGYSDPAKQKEIGVEIKEQIRMVLDSTDGSGVVHESVDAWNEHLWTRSWFGWANGLFGELIMKVAEEEEREGKLDSGWLAESWQ